MRGIYKCATSLLVLGGMAAFGHAATIITHSGATNPTTEGWTLKPIGLTPLAATGPILGDLGHDAWTVDDNASAFREAGYYNRALSATESADATARGWTLSATLRVVDVPDAVGGLAGSGAVHVGFGRFEMHFGSQADGDVIVQLPVDGAGFFNASPYVLEGTGGGYHDYALLFNPVAGSADLFVDGVERLSNYTGVISGGFSGINWGSVSPVDSGQGNYNFVRFEIPDDPTVPLPATVWTGLALLGSVAVWRRRRSPMPRWS